MSNLVIGTHNGTFHCDEVLACYLLKILPEYKSADIVRTRDENVIERCDIVVDVGSVYDHKLKRYDHHQRDFCDSMNSLDSRFPFKTKLSSAGLIYYHYGRHIIKEMFLDFKLDDSIIEKLFFKMYENCIEEIDAIDNGISVADETRYKITSTISNRVSFFNLNWNQESNETFEREAFDNAMKCVGEYFQTSLSYYIKSWLPARQIVRNSFDDRFNIHKCGLIVKLEKSCPWKEHLFDIENEDGCQNTILFCLFNDNNSNWRVQAVPLKNKGFENRMSLHSDWRGLRNEELSKISHIDGCIFVHSSGFIGGNKTYDGALKMALKTIEKNEKIV